MAVGTDNGGELFVVRVRFDQTDSVLSLVSVKVGDNFGNAVSTLGGGVFVLVKVGQSTVAPVVDASFRNRSAHLRVLAVGARLVLFLPAEKFLRTVEFELLPVDFEFVHLDEMPAEDVDRPDVNETVLVRAADDG